MGLTKAGAFTTEQNALANAARALAHPARIAIIEHLIRVDACICGDIVDELPLAQPTVSQHLRALRDAGLIRGTIEGTSICYCLEKVNWARLRQQLTALLDRCCDISGDACC